MTAPALLLLAACALAAPLHAASLPAEGRNSPALPGPADIPVQVLLENVEPSVKLNEVDGDEALRPPLDLRNPGPPQRQEHETQNPEQHPDDQLRVSSIKESIERTKTLLRESIDGVSENIQTWFYKNDDQNRIQNNIQTLRDTFSNQIQKLDEAIKALAKPASEPAELPAQKSLRNYAAIETELKTLKDNFNNDMETLSAGVELVSSLRSNVGEGDAKEDEVPAEANPEPAPPAPAPPAPAPPAPVKPGEATTPAPAGFIAQTMNNIFNGISTSFQNLQNLLTPPASPQPPASSQPPAEAQADAPAAPTARPPWSLPSFNFTNPLSQLQGSFANFTQNFQPPNGWFNGSFPTLQPIQNILPSFQNVLPPILRPSTTAKPAEAGNSAAAAEPAAAQPSADKPAADKPAAAPVPAVAADGPIRQFLNSIPVVQRIQSSLGNRDTPRQPAAAAAPAPAAPAAPAASVASAAAAPAAPAEQSDAQSKGGWYGRPGGGSGDNNDSGVSQTKSVEPKEILKDEIKEEAPVKGDSMKEEAVKPEIIKEEPIKEEALKTDIIKEEPNKEEVPKTDIIKEEPSKEEVKKEKEAEAKPESIPDKTE